MKRVKLTSEWLAEWNPKRREEVADGVCRGLLVRGGRSGAKVFYAWTDARDLATGTPRRKRVKLARWAVEGGGGAISLGAARERFLEMQEAKRAEVDGTAESLVKDVANAYRRDVLSHREHADEAWNVIRVHVVEAQPDVRRPAFGEWPARAVRPADVASIVRHAKEVRTVEARTRTGKTMRREIGGPVVGRVILRELKALFANAVETGALEMTPAGVMRARAFGLRVVSRNRTLDQEEIKALFAALDLTALLDGRAKPQRLTPIVRLGVAFQLYVPLRTHSLIGARLEEFDLDAARWTVPVDRLKLHAEERATARPFVVPLAPTAVAILRKLATLAADSRWVLASPLDPKAHIEDKALVRAVARLQTSGRLALGSRFTIHDLRRTWRSLAMDLGVDHVVAERSLGHVAALRAAGFGGSADVYGRAQMVDQREAAAKLVGAALDRIRLGAAAAVVPITSARDGSGA